MIQSPTDIVDRVVNFGSVMLTSIGKSVGDVRQGVAAGVRRPRGVGDRLPGPAAERLRR